MVVESEQRKVRQREQALARANEIRRERAQIKRDLKAVSRSDARDLLVDPPEVLEGMPLEEFLRALPRIGKVKARALAARVHVSPALPLRRLSPVTRRRLAELLP